MKGSALWKGARVGKKRGDGSRAVDPHIASSWNFKVSENSKVEAGLSGDNEGVFVKAGG